MEGEDEVFEEKLDGVTSSETTERREVTPDGTAVLTFEWDPRRHADTARTLTVDGAVVYSTVITTDAARPWTERTLETDGWADAPHDGTVDFVQTETWTCP